MQEDIGLFMLRIAKVSTLNGFGIEFLMFFKWDMCKSFATKNANMLEGQLVPSIGLKWGKVTFYGTCGRTVDNVYCV